MQKANSNMIPLESPSVEPITPLMRLLKIGSCPSLSGRSTLSYHIGSSLDIGDTETDDCQQGIYFRIHANTAKGFFSNDWIRLSAIHQLIDELPLGKGLTSSSLNSIFSGKSINTSGFLLAALKAEGLVVAVMAKRRYYERVSSDGFMTEMQCLISSSTNLNLNNEPAALSVVDEKGKKKRKEKAN